MKKRIGAALVGMMLVVAGCGRESATVEVTPTSASPSATATALVSASPTATALVSASPTAAAATATPAAATATPAASSTSQPSAAAAVKPTAAAATAAPTKEAATAKPTPAAAPASAAPSPSAKPQAADGGTTTAAQAQVLYKDNCMACHGAGLEGDFGPNLTKVGSRKTKDEITTQIIKGKGDMPPFQSALKSDEIEALAAWLAAKK